MMHARQILVLEDSDEDFATVLDAVQRAGVAHEVRRAISGDECLRLLRESALRDDALPVLILLDLNTPQGDGRDALREIRLDDRLRAIPLVVLTTSANPRDLHFCYASGANAYHVKPVQYPDHLQILEEIFGYWLKSSVLPT